MSEQEISVIRWQSADDHWWYTVTAIDGSKVGFKEDSVVGFCERLLGLDPADQKEALIILLNEGATIKLDLKHGKEWLKLYMSRIEVPACDDPSNELAEEFKSLHPTREHKVERKVKLNRQGLEESWLVIDNEDGSTSWVREDSIVSVTTQGWNRAERTYEIRLNNGGWLYTSEKVAGLVAELIDKDLQSA